jgi:hypothetical protein
VHDELAELLAKRVHQPELAQPGGRHRAGGGLPVADLVAVDDQHVGTGSRELAGDGEAGEACAADDHVGAVLERRALGAAPGGALWHCGEGIGLRRR